VLHVAQLFSSKAKLLTSFAKNALSRSLLALMILCNPEIQDQLAAATITVNSASDGGAGSLREALGIANSGDTIVFSLATPTTIRLTQGQLLLAKSRLILGPGPKLLSLDGGGNGRIFQTRSNTIVTIANLTLTNGQVIYPEQGGAIYNDHAVLSITNVAISGNAALGSSSGGGIFNDARQGGIANLKIIDSTFSGNMAEAGDIVLGGGAIYSIGCCTNADLILLNTTLNANSAPRGDGGAIFLDRGTMAITNCTVSSNFGGAYCGGIFNRGLGTSNSGSMKVFNCTFSGNWSGIDYGTAIFNDGCCPGVAALEIGSTLLDTGPSTRGIFDYFGGIISFGFNLSSDGGGGALTNATDLIFTNPKIGPLQDNGGPTWTHALLPGSPALDAGQSWGLATDQRGVARGGLGTGEPQPGDGTDIGAFEIGGNTRMVGILRTNHQVQLSFTSEQGWKYQMQRQVTLGASEWVDLSAPISGTGAVVTFVDQDESAGGLAQAYYRVRVVP
jgi:hypothetical protein